MQSERCIAACEGSTFMRMDIDSAILIMLFMHIAGKFLQVSLSMQHYIQRRSCLSMLPCLSRRVHQKS